MRGRARLATAGAVLVGITWLVLLPAGAQTQFTNPTPIVLIGPGVDGPPPPTSGEPYPSNITVSGLVGSVTDVNVILNGFDCSRQGFDYAFPEDVDMMLVGPTGTNAIILSDVGGDNMELPPRQFTDLTITIDDEAENLLSPDGQLESGTFKPTDDDNDEEEAVAGHADPFLAPAPAPSGLVALSAFDGTAPNGTWSLYVTDDWPGPDNCTINRGWTIEVSTTADTTTTTTAPTTTTTTPVESRGTYFPLPPARILDTRVGIGAPAAPVGPGAVLSFVVTGNGGVPAGDVSAVVLNMTVVAPTHASYMTVWPTGEPMPTASNLNYVAGQTVPNLVKAKVGAGGQVSVFNAAGNVHVLADVAGWYKAGASGPEGARFTSLTPSRILDTRTGIGAPATTVGPGQTVNLQVTGEGGVPATGVSAVTINVTAVIPTAPSYLTAWPTGETRPTASNLNYVAGDVVPNLVIVKVGSGGQVSLYNDSGQTHILADVVGWYSTPGGPGSVYEPLTPSRILDTRFGNGAPPGPVGPGSTVNLQVTNQGGVPATGVTAVALNVTAVGPTASSYLTAWPAGEARPTASNLNYSAGQVVPNLVVVKVGAGGVVSLYNDTGQTHVLADVVGWFGPG